MKKEPFQVSVNDQYQFDLHPDEVKSLDFIPANNTAFHVLENSEAFQVELLDMDYAQRRYTFRVEGNKYTVYIADYYERLVKKLGLSAGGGHKINSVKAPMPGLVMSILVTPGQSVSKGDPLLILEAMKMENVIKAAGDGVVKTVMAQKGEPVEKGHTLMEFE